MIHELVQLIRNTVYSNHAIEQLRAQGYSVLDTDEAKLSAFIREHIGIDGHYALHLPDLGGNHRPAPQPRQPRRLIQRPGSRRIVTALPPSTESVARSVRWYLEHSPDKRDAGFAAADAALVQAK
jgi:hypothetical protein